jgi:hypothetical protein
MAKADGILKIEGTVENLTFYKKDGKNFVRRKGGISRERIANDPSFVRTRENNSEFSLSARAGKVLRLALGSLVFKAKDNKLSSRLLKRMFLVKNYDTSSARGERLVAIGLGTVEGRQALDGFDFNVNAPLNNVLFAPYTFDVAAGKMAIPDLMPLEQLRYPEGATHVSFQSALLGIDFETEISNLVTSSIVNLPLNLTVTTVTLDLPNVPVTTGVTVMLMLISFFQEVNSVQYSLKNEEFAVLQIIAIE